MAYLLVTWNQIRGDEIMAALISKKKGARSDNRQEKWKPVQEEASLTAQLIDGLAVAAAIRDELKERVGRLREKGADPGLAFVIVGDNPASISYVRSKAQGCEQVGLRSETMNLPVETTQPELLALIDKINKNPAWSGMIVQLPLPPQIDPNAVASAIDPEKDADA